METSIYETKTNCCETETETEIEKVVSSEWVSRPRWSRNLNTSHIFPVAAPQEWNSLSVVVHAAASVTSIRRQLNTFLYR